MYKISLQGKEIALKRLVIKLGTRQITDTKSINLPNIQGLVEEIAFLREKVKDIILVTSGAIGLGVYEFYQGRGSISNLTLSQKQALAGVGQVKLMQIFKDEFKKYDIIVGQVLLTQNIFDNRKSYLNARNTLFSMLEMGILPVINENDSVATEEIKVGQNDTLGALVSLIVDADLYIMLSDVDGLYKNFNSDEMELIRVVEDVQQVIQYARGKDNEFTVGGMITKLEAARITTRSGIPTIIGNGFVKERLKLILEDFSIGTLFLPSPKALNHKKRWILGKRPRGIIYIDEGAKEAIRKNKSLLATGIYRVDGDFDYGDTVKIFDGNNLEIARGLTNYSSDQLRCIMGKKSDEIEKTIGEVPRYSCVIHIDNMVIF